MHRMSVPFIEENDQTRARQEHLEALRQLVGNAYPNKFERSHVVDPQREDTISSVVQKYRSFQPEMPEGERPAPERRRSAARAARSRPRSAPAGTGHPH